MHSTREVATLVRRLHRARAHRPREAVAAGLRRFRRGPHARRPRARRPGERRESGGHLRHRRQCLDCRGPRALARPPGPPRVVGAQTSRGTEYEPRRDAAEHRGSVDAGRSTTRTVEVFTARGLVTATTVGSEWLRPGALRALASGARWARAIEATRRCDGNGLSSPVSALNPAVLAPEWPGALVRQPAPREARRRRGAPRLHLQRAWRRLPHGKAGGGVRALPACAMVHLRTTGVTPPSRVRRRRSSVGAEGARSARAAPRRWRGGRAAMRCARAGAKAGRAHHLRALGGWRCGRGGAHAPGSVHVADRPNGATHVRLYGATHGC